MNKSRIAILEKDKLIEDYNEENEIKIQNLS